MIIEEVAGKLILIVEDKYLIGASLALFLEQVGARIAGPAKDVEEAMASLDPRPDIVILDIQLAVGTSFPVADELVRRGIRFIFATGTPSVIPAEHSRRLVCAKPYTGLAVVAALKAALAAPA
ncbi:response regulator [Sphingomonas solaris]|uniref:response regulator n=1 Tax=Alterirhizorhabdus solaris TaxID=2529389 RepID=UPI001396913F|nr:response regulator [Sphingomonas solaris]